MRRIANQSNRFESSKKDLKISLFHRSDGPRLEGGSWMRILVVGSVLFVGSMAVLNLRVLLRSEIRLLDGHSGVPLAHGKVDYKNGDGLDLNVSTGEEGQAKLYQGWYSLYRCFTFQSEEFPITVSATGYSSETVAIGFVSLHPIEIRLNPIPKDGISFPPRSLTSSGALPWDSLSVEVSASDSVGDVTQAPIASDAVSDKFPMRALVGWWAFEGGADEFFGRQPRGRIQGGTGVANRMGDSHAALSFRSPTPSSISLPLHAEVTDAFTIALWVKPGRSIETPPVSRICCGWTTVPMAHSNQNWALSPNHGGEDQLGVGISIGTNAVAISEHSHNVLVSRLNHLSNLEGYHHIVVTYSTSTVQLYLDGALVGQDEMWCRENAKKLGNSINLANQLYSPAFNGEIDDLGIWSRALTSAEIMDLYRSSGPPYSD